MALIEHQDAEAAKAFAADYARKIYEQNKAVGWWDDPDRCIFQTIQLISTEVAEATEGERKDLMDDHLPHRKMGEVELADAMIRLLDLAGRYEWDLEFPAYVRDELLMFKLSVGGYHLAINYHISNLFVVISDAVHMQNYDVADIEVTPEYSSLYISIECAAEILSYDLWGAVEEKLAYNAQRQDHKRENRAKEHGKKF